MTRASSQPPSAGQGSDVGCLIELATRLFGPNWGLGPAWRQAFANSPMRLPAAALDNVEPIAASLGHALALALEAAAESGLDMLKPGAAAVRELERSASFAGAAMASPPGGDAAGRGYDVAACVLSLRDVALAELDVSYQPALRGLFDWLLAVALDSFAGARTNAAYEHMQGQLEAGTPVVLVCARVPAVMLLGSPSAAVLDAVFGRAVLLIVTQDAPVLIIDASGLSDPTARAVLDGLGRLAGYSGIAGAVELLVVGLADEQAAAWTRVIGGAGARMARVERFRDAVERALAVLNRRITSSPT